MTKLLPLGENVVIESTKEENVTASGLYVHKTDEKKPGQGRVLAVGPGANLPDGSLSKMHVTEGDVVVFRRYAPDEFEIDGVKYLVIPQKDILGKIV